MALNRHNTNPALAVYDWQPNAGYVGIVPPSGSPGSAPGDRAGNGWQWVVENGDEVADTIGSVWCLINPRRAGCPGDPARNPTVIQQQSIPGWLIGLILIIVLLLIYLALKK